MKRFFYFIRGHSVESLTAAGVILSIALRLTLIDFVSRDYVGFFSNWYDFIVANGGFQALRYDFSNYNPPYLYMMVIVIKLFPGLPKLYAMKFISIFFDLVLGIFVYELVRLRYGRSILCFFACMAFLFAPTVFLNSALWGQTDAIYTSGLMACLYFICSSHPWAAMASFGFAFSVKAQAIFWTPFLVALLIKKKLPWKCLSLAAAVYLLSLLPAWLAGRPFLELLSIYPQQSGFYHELTKNAPTFYVWFPNSSYPYLYRAGTLLAAAIALCFVVGVFKSSKNMDAPLLMQLALASVLSMVYFLPKMHERYFFSADVLSIVYAFYFPKYFLVPVMIIFCSMISYLPYLFGTEVPLRAVSIAMSIVVIFVVRQLSLELK